MTNPIKEIRERWAKATPGPWWFWGLESLEDNNPSHLHGDADQDILFGQIEAVRHEDLIAIECSRADIATLLAENDRLREENAKLRTVFAVKRTTIDCRGDTVDDVASLYGEQGDAERVAAALSKRDGEHIFVCPMTVRSHEYAMGFACLTVDTKEGE